MPKTMVSSGTRRIPPPSPRTAPTIPAPNDVATSARRNAIGSTLASPHRTGGADLGTVQPPEQAVRLDQVPATEEAGVRAGSVPFEVATREQVGDTARHARGVVLVPRHDDRVRGLAVFIRRLIADPVQPVARLGNVQMKHGRPPRETSPR